MTLYVLTHESMKCVSSTQHMKPLLRGIFKCIVQNILFYFISLFHLMISILLTSQAHYFILYICQPHYFCKNHNFEVLLVYCFIFHHHLSPTLDNYGKHVLNVVSFYNITNKS